MPIYTIFWERIAEDLKNEHSDNQHPYEWKKSEIESFIRDSFLLRIYNYLKTNKKGGIQAPSFTYYTFRRIFKTKEKYNAGPYTQNLFAWYFGYADADMYLSAERASKYSGLASISALINQYMQVEFNAYLSVPKINTAKKILTEYFIPEGPAYKKVIGVIQNQTTRGWVITNPNNPSAYEIIDAKIKETFNNKAIIETHEHWVLKWYSHSESNYKFSYNHTNYQSYILKKVDGQWKIWSNSYPTTEKYLPPLEVSSELKAQIHQISGLECRNFLEKMIEEGKTMVAFYLLKVKLKDGVIKNKVIVLKSQFDHLIDRINNERISIEEFYTKKGEFDLKLLDLLNSL